jgi:hypothetical protein
MQRTLTLALVATLMAMVWTAAAAARGGSYAFDGGTPRQQAQVVAALNASSFNWSLVPATVTIHLEYGTATRARQGEIWIDTKLLASGVFAWGLIQHEYAHQVDFFLLDDAKRALLNRALHGSAWWNNSTAYAPTERNHASLGSERFASTLAWTYWQSPSNSLKPTSASDESAAMAPAKFRQLLGQMLGIEPAIPVVTAG